MSPSGRRLAYLFLVYTEARKNEVAALLWSDLDLGEKPAVLFRSETTKDKDSRPVPLNPELAALLRESKASATANAVFSPFPSDDALHADLRRAGIERKDATGRVLHFHAFRKTFQTWGAVAGIGQRSAQEMLGHSAPSLTAGVYTDVAALQLHSEVAKLPWVGSQGGVAIDAQKCARIAAPSRFRSLLSELIELAKDVLPEGEKTDLPTDLIGCPTWIRTMTR